MDGFTLVLLTAWLVLVGTFVGMYTLDQATKKTREKRAKVVEQAPAKRR